MVAQQKSNTDRIRLDLFLTQDGHFETRARARDAITRGSVSINGVVQAKPGIQVHPEAEIAINDQAQNYVSRAALKLIAGLDHFQFDPREREALDIGASTGGFSQVLLERGASHVTAIDVGHGQMHPSIHNHPRLENHEGVNARSLNPQLIADRSINIVVSDVSFISIKLALPPALAMAASGCFCVLLVKPQFEAGREAIGKGGLLKDPTLGHEIADGMAEWLNEQTGWQALGYCPSPISGGDGNLEYLLGGVKS